MFGLLAPLWLLAAAAIAAPLILHLISRGRVRRVRIGSVRLLEANESRRLRRFKPRQPLLLAVRCALLLALALALAEPRARIVGDAPEARGWILAAVEVLTDRTRLEPANRETYRELDALEAKGDELRLLAKGIPAGSPRGEVASDGPLDAWSLLLEADALAPPGIAFHVFVPDRLSGLVGSRPILGRSVTWRGLSDDATRRWIERAGPARGDRLPLLVGESTSERTTFARRSVTLLGDAPREAATGSGIALTVADGRAALALSDSDGVERPAVSLTLQQAPVQVGLFYDLEREQDAGYVRTALEAVAAYSGVALAIVQEPLPGTSNPGMGNELDADLDLLFGLAPSPLPPPVVRRLRQGAILITDGPDRYESCEGAIVFPHWRGFDPPRLRRCSPIEDGAATPVWDDGAGRTVLDVIHEGDVRHYRLHGRFHPSWSDLPFDESFPAWMLDLVDRVTGDRVGRGAASAADRRAAGAQALPVSQPGSQGDVRLSDTPRRLAWGLVLLLFAAERRLARVTR